MEVVRVIDLAAKFKGAKTFAEVASSDIASMGMDATEMLGSILKAIEKEAESKWAKVGIFNAHALLNIKSLAMTESYMADDFNNSLDCLLACLLACTKMLKGRSEVKPLRFTLV